jgi:hypothetical protein
MKALRLLPLALALAGPALSQTAASPAPSPPPAVQATLQQIEQTAQAAALDLARLRIDKWKTEGEIKSQAQSNADSISRNLTSALPALIAAVRTSPQNLAPNFKLYRNLNALYDVFEGLAESAGAFGTKQEYEALSRHVQDLDTYRRSFGDSFESLASAKDAELNRVRVTSAVPTKPKKIIVDNTPTPKSTKKKK